MSGNYNPDIHSKSKLGAIGVIPFLPMMPTAAQLRFGPMGINVHYRLVGESYVSGGLPTIPPTRVKVVQQAMALIPRTDPSYSGSGSLYQAVTVEPGADGRTFTLKAGETTLGIGYVDPDAPIVSTDESIADQIAHGEGSDDPPVMPGNGTVN